MQGRQWMSPEVSPQPTPKLLWIDQNNPSVFYAWVVSDPRYSGLQEHDGQNDYLAKSK